MYIYLYYNLNSRYIYQNMVEPLICKPYIRNIFYLCIVIRFMVYKKHFSIRPFPGKVTKSLSE